MSKTIDRAQAIALSLHPWHNTADDWKALQRVVNDLGRSAPKMARDALAQHRRRTTLPNPFANLEA